MGWIEPVTLTGTHVNLEPAADRHLAAFETLRANRVAIKTDIRNERSQVAIARLGAVREGIIRHQMVRKDDTLRDTVLFSILPEEWPQVRAHLQARLADHA